MWQRSSTLLWRSSLVDQEVWTCACVQRCVDLCVCTMTVMPWSTKRCVDLCVCTITGMPRCMRVAALFRVKATFTVNNTVCESSATAYRYIDSYCEFGLNRTSLARLTTTILNCRLQSNWRLTVDWASCKRLRRTACLPYIDSRPWLHVLSHTRHTCRLPYEVSVLHYPLLKVPESPARVLSNVTTTFAER